MDWKGFFRPTIGKVAITIIIFIISYISAHCFIFDAPLPKHCTVSRVLSIPYVILSFLIGRITGDSWDSVMHNYLVLFTIGVAYSYIMSSIILSLFAYIKNKIKSQP